MSTIGTIAFFISNTSFSSTLKVRIFVIKDPHGYTDERIATQLCRYKNISWYLHFFIEVQFKKLCQQIFNCRMHFLEIVFFYNRFHHCFNFKITKVAD